MDTYSQVIHQSRYARWSDEQSRRETWDETVARYCANWTYELSEKEYNKVYNAIYNMDVMPSMRAMWSSGPALERNNISGYNCAFVVADSPRVFDETLYILACGTGVGYSVEAQYVNKLPIINDHFEEADGAPKKIEDSKEGWAKALRTHIRHLYLGEVLSWDYSAIRPAGSRLKTMGGRASGPEPLVELIDFVTNTFKSASGRKLTPMECHDILCKIGEVIVVGGVRRSAMISLSDLGDDQLRYAKSGAWWETTGHRALANNSAVYESKPDMETFIREWLALIRSKSGERGIYSRYAAQQQAPERRKSEQIQGTNPCAEISLRSMQFCNLTEVVLRQEDTLDDIKEKIKTATILGTLQATLTNFPYLRKGWTTNTEEERLLGVSLTGICDCPRILEATEEELQALRAVAVNTNIEWADRLGINRSTAVTTIKPSGTVSQLVDSSSGIHGRFSPFYVRTIRQSKNDPMTQFMVDAGIPSEDCVAKPHDTTVFSFPMKSPKGALIASEMSALEQLEMWKLFKLNWAEHSVSVTVYVKEHEWMAVGDWVYNNFDCITGISFLPATEHTYQQAPYQPIKEEQYVELLSSFPNNINFNDLRFYEAEDNTEGAQTLACTGGACEIK